MHVNCQLKRKRGAFTLIEMLIVVVVLVTLMSMVFRLSSIGDESTCRVNTVERMQKLENCLSGYYAAFGCYPPVPLHGSHDIYFRVDAYGIQLDDRNENVLSGDENTAWKQVNAACRAQPVACRFPFPSGYSEMVKSISDEIIERINAGDPDYEYLNDPAYAARKALLLAGFDDGVSQNAGRFGNVSEDSDWRSIQLFQFGLMSFLLPRYSFMMQSGVANGFYENCAQWTANNTEPCDPFDGERKTWSQWQQRAQNTNPSALDTARFANIPSQAACARWMPNLASLCDANHGYDFFGINIRRAGSLHATPNIELFTPGEHTSESSSGGQTYVLDSITIKDGWNHEFYYYSPSPYQTYSLWSAGANAKTFPPWISRANLSSEVERKLVAKWTIDDIIHMSN